MTKNQWKKVIAQKNQWKTVITQNVEQALENLIKAEGDIDQARACLKDARCLDVFSKHGNIASLHRDIIAFIACLKYAECSECGEPIHDGECAQEG